MRPYRCDRASAAAGAELAHETYAQAHRERQETIVPFLRRVWLPLIETGVLNLRTPRARDPSAAKRIDNIQQRIDPTTRQRRRPDWALRGRAREIEGKTIDPFS